MANIDKQLAKRVAGVLMSRAAEELDAAGLSVECMIVMAARHKIGASLARLSVDVPSEGEANEVQG